MPPFDPTRPQTWRGKLLLFKKGSAVKFKHSIFIFSVSDRAVQILPLSRIAQHSMSEVCGQVVGATCALPMAMSVFVNNICDRIGLPRSIILDVAIVWNTLVLCCLFICACVMSTAAKFYTDPPARGNGLDTLWSVDQGDSFSIIFPPLVMILTNLIAVRHRDKRCTFSLSRVVCVCVCEREGLHGVREKVCAWCSRVQNGCEPAREAYLSLSLVRVRVCV